jgi:streptogramin lyase
MFALSFFAAAAVGVLALGTHAAARTAPNPAQVTITQFRDLLRGHFANCLASGPDQSLWVTDSTDQDFGVSKIVQVGTSGRRLHAFGYPGIVAGPDGNMWFVEANINRIGRVTL